jgi:8-oxo-dGTP pyrophosphatase MutT (NUDIX family)
MNGFLRHLKACNPPIREPFVPWYIGSEVVGWLRPAVAEALRDYPDVFAVESDRVALQPGLQGFEVRSAALERVVRGLAGAGVTAAYLGEVYPVAAGGRDAALCVIDRAAAPYFGVRTYGQHLNGFVRLDDGIHMWLGRRAQDRQLFPGALDNMVAGGLPHGVSLAENLAKECAEEAGMAAELAARALPVGVVSYNRVAPRGLRRDLLYCYDLELPADFVPVNTDGEVESFMLLPLQEVADIVHDTDEFKLNCNLVVIDFLVRHGWLDPGSPVYVDLVTGLRATLEGLPRDPASRG